MAKVVLKDASITVNSIDLSEPSGRRPPGTDLPPSTEPEKR